MDKPRGVIKPTFIEGIPTSPLLISLCDRLSSLIDQEKTTSLKLRACVAQRNSVYTCATAQTAGVIKDRLLAEWAVLTTKTDALDELYAIETSKRTACQVEVQQEFTKLGGGVLKGILGPPFCIEFDTDLEDNLPNELRPQFAQPQNNHCKYGFKSV